MTSDNDMCLGKDTRGADWKIPIHAPFLYDMDFSVSCSSGLFTVK